MTRRVTERYEVGPDGLPVERVREWSAEKHERLRKYVDATWAARRRFLRSEASYIDLYSGPGRAIVGSTREMVDGSPLVAASEAAKHVSFSSMHIGDKNREIVDACATRLKALKVNGVHEYCGEAKDTACEVVTKLHPHGLHLAFLDPYAIKPLPFVVLQTLGSRQRMDLLIHISKMDLQRNVKQYFVGDGTLDAFAPGWRDHCDPHQRDDVFVHQVLGHWRGLLAKLNYKVNDNIELVTGSKNQHLYWLVFASRDNLADKLWNDICNIHPQRRLGL